MPSSSTANTPLRPSVACARMGVSTQTLRRWITKGLIHVQYTAGGQVRVPVAEIERIIKTGKDRRLMERSAFEAASPERRAVLTRQQMSRAEAQGREIARHYREWKRRRQQKHQAKGCA